MAELKRSMTAREWRAWVEYYRMHPWDDLHRYHRGPAVLASIVAGALGRRVPMEDFLPWRVSRAAREMPYDMIEAMMLSDTGDDRGGGRG